jgi:hypothetical protein
MVYEPDSLPDKTIVGIIETIFPNNDIVHFGKRHHMEVSNWVITRIRGLPRFMRIPVRISMIFLELSSLITELKLFSDLDLGSRKKHILRVQRWPVSYLKDVVKLITSLTMFAYYDNEVVRQAIGFVEVSVDQRACAG